MKKKIIISIGIIAVLGIGVFYGRYTQSSTTVPVETTAKLENPSTDASINEYMKTNNITLKAKDAQFDMKNNLNKDFAIEGLAILGDYYNYGYKDEGNYFCIKVNVDDTAGNSWYLYCNRIIFSELYNLLKEGKNVPITATCKISKSVYKAEQGNMAEVSNIEWIKN